MIKYMILYLWVGVALWVPNTVAQKARSVDTKFASCFGGPYIGIALGYGACNARVDQRVAIANNVAISGTIVNDINRSYLNKLCDGGMHAGALLGYGHQLCCSQVYLGFEMGYFGDTVEADYAYAPGTNTMGTLLGTQIKHKDRVELTARMGWIRGQVMPYVKLGWVGARVQATQTVVAPNDADTTLAVLRQPFLNKRINGFLIGLGIDIKLSPHWIAGGAYTHVRYPEQQGPLQVANTSIEIPTLSNGWNHRIKLSDNRFRVKLTYLF